MVIDQPGRVTERITLLGRPESCVYLVDDGRESVLMGGGMAYIVPDLLGQIASLGIDERRIGRICVLHAHFDHCGAVPFLKRRWPWATVTASVRAGQLLANPKIQQSIAAMNLKATERAGLSQEAERLGSHFDHLEIEATVAEGAPLSCGDLNIEVLEVPGHSSCSIAMFIPEEQALFASDAVGMRQGGVYHPTPNSNFDQYQESLERLARLQPEVLLLEHFGAYLGQDAYDFFPGAIDAARHTRRLIEETYRRTGDVETCSREITQIFLSRSGDTFLSDEVRALVAAQMVRFIAGKMEV